MTAHDPEPFSESEWLRIVAMRQERILDQDDVLEALLQARGSASLIERDLQLINADVDDLTHRMDAVGKARAAWRRRTGT